MWKQRTLAPMLAAAFLFSLATNAPSEEKEHGVGSFAPELVPGQWMQKDKNNPTEIHRLRGKVVLVHTFAYLCDG